jgi:heme-degrading monooxygenase HmoA
MVVRIWRGQATREKAPAYYRHVTGKVFPELKGLAGHKGAYLLQRETAAGVEFLAVTLWESLAAIRAFAGEEAEAAVVEPAAQAVLADFDDFARHYELTYGGEFGE